MSEAVPAWAYEVADVKPYDPVWAVRGEREVASVAELLAERLVDGVEHIGSTSVPGLAAKPIVDVMASVTDPDAVVAAYAARLAELGWCFVPPELDQRSWRRFFVKPDASGRHREAHLHVIAAGDPRWRDQLDFRDALRGDGALVAEYAALKRGLAARHGHDRESYTEGKSAFVASVLKGQRMSLTSSVGRASRVPLSVTTNGRSITAGLSAMMPMTSSSDSSGLSRPSSL